MTREQAKKKLVDFGIAEPTEEQVTKLLDEISVATKSEKDNNSALKAENDRLKEENGKLGELQKQIDEAENAKLSEMEKLTKALETSAQEVATLKRDIAIRDQKATIAEKFKVTAEQVNKIVKADGTLDYDILGQIISEKETAAALAKEQEIAKASTNPGGQSGGGEEKSVAMTTAKEAAKRAGTANQNILDHYRRH